MKNYTCRECVFVIMMIASLMAQAAGALADTLGVEPCSATSPCDELPLNEEQKALAVPEVSYDKLRSMIDAKEPFVLLDARDATMYSEGHIPGAISFPLELINEETARQRLKPDDDIVVYCQSRECRVSHNAALLLISYGFRAKDYKGGFEQWSEHGQPLEK